MKKLLLIIMSATLAVSLCACSKGGNVDRGDDGIISSAPTANLKDDIEKGADKVKDGVKDGADKVGDKLDDMADSLPSPDLKQPRSTVKPTANP